MTGGEGGLVDVDDTAGDERLELARLTARLSPTDQ